VSGREGLSGEQDAGDHKGPHPSTHATPAPTDEQASQAVVYDSVPLGKLAEHGGRGSADQNIMIVMEGPGVQSGYTINQHVWLMQVGTTVAADMCLNLANATYSPLPGTSADNNNCQYYRTP
jgi:hypothetical protein